MKETVIVAAVRTAIGDFEGVLKDTSALELGKTVILEAIRRAGIKKEDVNEVIFGNVLPGGLGQNPARQAMLLAKLPVDTAALTVNKVCASGLKALALADQAIKADESDIIIAGGMENMYLAPYYLPKARSGYRLWDGKLVDVMVHDGLWDLLSDTHMGALTENVADRYEIPRQEQDRFSLSSYRKARQAIAAGAFKAEIIPIELPQRKGPPIIVDTDEGAQRDTSMEALAKLPPVFREKGTITAGNSSKLSMGAAALVVMSKEKAQKLGLKPLGRIVGHATAGIDVTIPTAAPINSIPKLLKKVGLQEKEIDLHEINEAFAASTLAVIKAVKIDEEKVNVKGGAIALGHPIGCSGARVVVTMLGALQDRKARLGMASVCLGGAEAVSMIVERL